jgi:hypothetical protein
MSNLQSGPVSPKRLKPTRSTWVGLVVVALLLLLFGASAGWAGLLVAAATAGIFTGLYVALSGRRSWALIASRKIGLVVLFASVVVLFVGAGVAPHPKTSDASKPEPSATSHLTAQHGASPSASPTPQSTATPAPVVVVDVNSQEGASARSALLAEGLTVQLVYADGTAVADPTGLLVVDEVPAAGSSAILGSPVVLTLSEPVVVPAPAPVVPAAPAAPPPAAPAPAAPAAPTNPSGATALCNDGTLSYSAHRSGTCSHHGGVAQWY